MLSMANIEVSKWEREARIRSAELASRLPRAVRPSVLPSLLSRVFRRRVRW